MRFRKYMVRYYESRPARRLPEGLIFYITHCTQQRRPILVR